MTSLRFLVSILVVVALTGTGVLIEMFILRLEMRKFERKERAELHARLQRTIARLELGACAYRGHKYQPSLILGSAKWFCPVCGHRVVVPDEGDTA